MDKDRLEKLAADWQAAYVEQGHDAIRAAKKAGRAHATATAILRLIFTSQTSVDRNIEKVTALVVAHDAAEHHAPPEATAFDRLAAAAVEPTQPDAIESAPAPAEAEHRGGVRGRGRR